MYKLLYFYFNIYFSYPIPFIVYISLLMYTLTNNYYNLKICYQNLILLYKKNRIIKINRICKRIDDNIDSNIKVN